MKLGLALLMSLITLPLISMELKKPATINIASKIHIELATYCLAFAYNAKAICNNQMVALLSPKNVARKEANHIILPRKCWWKMPINLNPAEITVCDNGTRDGISYNSILCWDGLYGRSFYGRCKCIKFEDTLYGYIAIDHHDLKHTYYTKFGKKHIPCDCNNKAAQECPHESYSLIFDGPNEKLSLAFAVQHAKDQMYHIMIDEFNDNSKDLYKSKFSPYGGHYSKTVIRTPIRQVNKGTLQTLALNNFTNRIAIAETSKLLMYDFNKSEFILKAETALPDPMQINHISFLSPRCMLASTKEGALYTIFYDDEAQQTTFHRQSFCNKEKEPLMVNNFATNPYQFGQVILLLQKSRVLKKSPWYGI